MLTFREHDEHNGASRHVFTRRAQFRQLLHGGEVL